MGVASRNPPRIIFKDFPPTSNDITNFQIGSIWIDKLTDNVYMLVNKAAGIATWTFIGGSAVSTETITTPDGTVVTPTAENINFLNGTDISITGSGSDITFDVTTTAGKIPWNVITDPTATLIIDEGFFASNAAGVTLTLPTTCAVGDFINVSAINAGGWTISQNALQRIHLGITPTTIGVTGSLVSTQNFDSIQMVCSIADTEFVVISSIGNITIN